MNCDVVGMGGDPEVIVGVATTAEFVCFATHALNSGNKSSVNICLGTKI